MNTRNLIPSTLGLVASLAVAGTVLAQPLDLTLSDPNQTVTQGTTTIAFDATIFNPSTTDTIFLNGDAATTSSSSLIVDDSPFFANAPLFLAPGQSSGPFELFDVDLAPGTLAGSYALNTFSILGGADGGTSTDFSDVADATFSVSVSPAVVSAPEPDAFMLALTGFAIGIGQFAFQRRRASKRVFSFSVQ